MHAKKNQKYLLIVKAESFEKVSISMGFVEKETFRRENSILKYMNVKLFKTVCMEESVESKVK